MSLAGFAFGAAGLERAAHLRGSADALDALWPRARVLRLDGESRALDAAAHDDWPLGASLAAIRPADAVFLGLIGTQACFVLEQQADGQPTTDLRRAGMQWPALSAAVFATAAGLLNWRRRSRFCGGCGGELDASQGGWSMRCARCGLETYPRTDQAIIVAVSSGDRLLLGRQQTWPAGRWSLVAGFVEPGETLAQAVAREVAEETAVQVRDVVYADSQPWPFPSALMLGFFAEADADAADPVVGDELEAARWFSLDEVRAGLAVSDTPSADVTPPLAFAPRLSIARALIEAWASGRRGGAPR